MIKVVKFKKLRGSGKKYEITFNKNGKKYIRKFGSAGMSDFTKHKDKERRERYISRHKKDLKTKDPMKPGYLSMFILWNKPSLKASLADYKRRLGVYNRTGKFPIKITGSKNLKFGMFTPIRELLYNKGDKLGVRTLKSIGIDPYLRARQDHIEEYNRFLAMNNDAQARLDAQFSQVNQVTKPFEIEMSGGRVDDTYKKDLAAIKIAWRKYKNKPTRYRDWVLINKFGYSVPKNVVNKKLYLSIKNNLKKKIKGRRWGAYDSGRLVKMYKKRGGKYKGGKGKTNLGRWYKEKWVNACAWPKRKPCGRKTKSKIAYCRPSKRIDSKTPKLIQSLSKSTIKSRCAKKRKSRFGVTDLNDFDWTRDTVNNPDTFNIDPEEWDYMDEYERADQWVSVLASELAYDDLGIPVDEDFNPIVTISWNEDKRRDFEKLYDYYYNYIEDIRADEPPDTEPPPIVNRDLWAEDIANFDIPTGTAFGKIKSTRR